MCSPQNHPAQYSLSSVSQSLVPASLQSLSHTPSPIRSPKMGRRALQRSPKPGGSLASTPTPSESGDKEFEARDAASREVEDRVGGTEKSLDRVLLERNLDRYWLAINPVVLEVYLLTQIRATAYAWFWSRKMQLFNNIFLFCLNGFYAGRNK